MKKSLKKFKINKLKLGMFFLVFSMSIGFAALNTKLNLNGYTSLAYSGDTNFLVYFSRAFLNDMGKSNIISEDKNSITFSYTDINHRDADLKYTIKNTSNSYYADVDVSCKARKKDGTKFLYDENNYISKKLRVEPGQSLTSDLSVLLPGETTTPSDSSVENTNLASYIKSLSKGSDSSINFDNLNESGVYESTNTDSGKSVYYYRGREAEVKNYVLFAERCWKILRTSENGGIKLIYSGIPNGNSCLSQGAFLGIQAETIEVNSSTKYNNNAYAGYMYGSLNASDYSSAHQNKNDSVFKTELDKWYENNILNTDYEQYVLDDVYYNDRAVLTDYSNINSSTEYEGLGYGTHTALYESASRVSPLANSLTPTYKTPNLNDSFTVSDTTNGNGALKYPVSTLTADELVYAGATKSGASSWLYIYNRLLLTMSPVGFYDGTMNFVIQKKNGTLGTIPSDSSESLYILPTITISADLNILSGDGSNSSPFVLSSEDIYENTYTCTLNVDKIGYSKDVEVHNPLMDLEVGEEYCFEDECFYTISNDKKGTVKLLAKYNLYVGNIYSNSSNFTTISTSDSRYGKQHYTAVGAYVDDKKFPRIGTTAYSSNTSDNSYANSVVKTYVDAYGEYMRELTGINMSASLITRDELINLGCVSNSTGSNCNNPNFDWVTGTTYWTMTPGNGTVYLVGADGFFNASIYPSSLTNKDSRGVRPVITVSYAAKNPDVTFVTGNGENVGDELCIGEECFYVLNYDGNNYTLFAKYNLYVGKEYASNSKGATISTSDPLYGKQNSLALGDHGSPVYGTLKYTDAVIAVNNYVSYLTNTFGINISSGRLITPSELSGLGCDANRYINDTSAYKNWGCEYPGYSNYSWVLNSTYWAESTSSKIYLVGGDGFYKPLDRTSAQESNSNARGARPVIVVPATEIKSPDYIVPSTSYPSSWDDNGIFSEYYDQAYEKLKTMTTSEKVGQLLIMSYNPSDPTKADTAVQKYHVSGVLFFENAFTGKTISQVQEMTSSLQAQAKIPLVLPVDEEGGRVVRISPNLDLVANEVAQYPNLFYTNTNNKNAWKLASDLYTESGNNFNLIVQEEQVRNNLLKKLGLNMNFAPVVDIATPPAYISDRSFGDNPELTAQYAKTVIEAGKDSGISHSMKHFPGYGNNADTHSSSSVDETSMEDLRNIHLVPFIAGINAGAESVMISHNIIAAIDKNSPASLSKGVHDLLFDDLGFTGLAITDDLGMSAVGTKYPKQYLQAFQAGNHLILTNINFDDAHTEIMNAINDGTISMDELNKRVFKVLAWKYYKGLL